MTAAPHAARGWATERGLAGRSLQAPTVLAVVVGALLALAVAALAEHDTIARPAMVVALLGACAGAGLLARHLAARYTSIPR